MDQRRRIYCQNTVMLMWRVVIDIMQGTDKNLRSQNTTRILTDFDRFWSRRTLPNTTSVADIPEHHPTLSNCYQIVPRP